MIDAEWWDYEDEGELAEAVAGDIGFVIESAIDARGDAVVALPGGRTPVAALELLAARKLEWKRVTIVPTDDRLVPVTDALSNAGMLARLFMPKGARVVPIAGDQRDYHQAGRAAAARISDLHWPLDLVVLGMGEDGHTASIFPGPDFAAALDAPKAVRAIGVMPDPLPADAPVARVTLTRAAIVSARALTVVITGKEKQRVLKRAIKEAASSPLPIGRVLAEAEQAIDIHWCA